MAWKRAWPKGRKHQDAQVSGSVSSPQHTNPRSSERRSSRLAQTNLDTPQSNDATEPSEVEGARNEKNTSLRDGLFPGGETLGLRVISSPIDSIVDIIFVHGLTGDAFDTWYKKVAEAAGQEKAIALENNGQQNDKELAHQRDSGGIYWPLQLLPNELPDARILTFGYDADITHVFGAVGQEKLRDHADTLLGDMVRLRDADDTQDRKIIWIAHSLGGLVVKKALCLSESSFEVQYRQAHMHTIGVAFLGTPHRGSSFAKYGQGLAYILRTFRKRTNTNIVALLKPGSEVLTDVEESFGIWLRKQGQNVQIAPFYEELELPVVGFVVDKDSAKVLGYVPIPIHANHMDMTKFRSKDDLGYQRIVGQITSWLKPVRQQVIIKNELTQLEEECLRALHYDGIGVRQETLAEAFPDTFEWVWEMGEPRLASWILDGKEVFWIRGKPGSGKSTLVKYLADNGRLRLMQYSSSQNLPARSLCIATHFFEYNGSELLRSTEGLLRSILWQILKQTAKAFPGVLAIYEDKRRTQSAFRWSERDLEQSLRNTLGLIEDIVVVFVDALDEFDGEYERIVDCILRYSHTFPSNVRICVSSRSNAELDHFSHHLPGLVVEQMTRQDVERYATSTLGRFLRTPEYGDLGSLIFEDILKRAHGVFLWVKLVILNVTRAFSKYHDPAILWKKIQELPKDLSQLYQRIVDSMEDDVWEEVERMLAITTCAARSLTISEFCYVIGFQRNSLSPSLIEKRIQVMCIGLLEIRGGKVHFAHETVLAFIRSSSTRVSGRLSKNALQKGHAHMLASCLDNLRGASGLQAHYSAVQASYMIHDEIDSRLTREDYRSISTGIFSTYAVLHWKDHEMKLHNFCNVDACSLPDQPWFSIAQYLVWLEWYLVLRWQADGLTSSRMGSPKHNIASLIQLSMLHNINMFPGHSQLAFDWNDLDYRHFATNSRFSFASKRGMLSTIQVSLSFTELNNQLHNSLRYVEDQTNSSSKETTEDVQLRINVSLKQTRISNSVVAVEVPNAPRSAFLVVPLSKSDLADSSRSRITPTNLSHSRIEAKDIAFPMSHLTQSEQNENCSLYWRYPLLTGTPQRSPSLRGIVEHVMMYGDPHKFAHSKIQYLDPGTPLQYAAFHSLNSLLHALLANGANPDNANKSSMFGTPLIAAIYSIEKAFSKGGGVLEHGLIPQLTAIETLLEWNADPNLAASGTWAGLKTPLEAACRIHRELSSRVGVSSHHLEQAINLLFRHGAKPDAITRSLIRPTGERGSKQLWRLFQDFNFVKGKNIWKGPRSLSENILDSSAEQDQNSNAAQSPFSAQVPASQRSRPAQRRTYSVYPLRGTFDGAFLIREWETHFCRGGTG